MPASVYIIEGITGAGKDTICNRLLELLYSDTRPVYYFPKETVGFYYHQIFCPGITGIRLSLMEQALDFGLTLSTQEDLQYLKACAALGIDPNTGEKVDNGKRDRGNPVPNGADKGPRGESLTAMTQRLERERAEENRRNWLEHCDRMYRTHVGIAQEWAQKRADILQASRRIYARKRYTKPPSSLVARILRGSRAGAGARGERPGENRTGKNWILSARLCKPNTALDALFAAYLWAIG